MPNHSQERGRRVVFPPTKARSCRPKELPPVRPPPRRISSAFAGSRVVHENSPELRFAGTQGHTLGTIMQFNPGLKIVPGNPDPPNPYLFSGPKGKKLIPLRTITVSMLLINKVKPTWCTTVETRLEYL